MFFLLSTLSLHWLFGPPRRFVTQHNPWFGLLGHQQFPVRTKFKAQLILVILMNLESCLDSSSTKQMMNYFHSIVLNENY